MKPVITTSSTSTSGARGPHLCPARRRGAALLGASALLGIIVGCSDDSAPLASAVPTQPPTFSSAPDFGPVPDPAGVDDGTGDVTFRAVATAIQAPGGQAMIAFALAESLPPQGGDVPMTNFSWDDVIDEQTASGTTWKEGLEFVGHRKVDGTFELIQPPKPAAAPQPQLTYGRQTSGCADSTAAKVTAAVNSQDGRGLGIISVGDYTFDGHCGAAVTALFDTPELRTAVSQVAGVDADVSYEFMFLPTDDAPDA